MWIDFFSAKYTLVICMNFCAKNRIFVKVHPPKNWILNIFYVKTQILVKYKKAKKFVKAKKYRSPFNLTNFLTIKKIEYFKTCWDIQYKCVLLLLKIALEKYIIALFPLPLHELHLSLKSLVYMRVLLRFQFSHGNKQQR